MKLLRNQQSNRNYLIFSIEFSSSQLSIVSISILVLAFASITTWFLIIDQECVNQRNLEKWYQQQASSQTFESAQYQASYQSSYQKNQINYSKKLVLLEKIYKNDDKFDIVNDNFDFKIMIYYDKYKRVDLFSRVYDEDASIMFRDQTVIYFYINRHAFESFNDFCINIKNFFENLE
jgi:hypothetical protein